MASAYTKLSPLEHVLARPDTYIGSVETSVDAAYVLNDAGDGMEWKSAVTHNPGLYKIVDEIVTNAIDQSVVDSTVDKIAIVFDADAGTISVTNTGRGIPVGDVHPEYGIYAPELIFGNLLTSSNYDDSKDRIVGGKNGLGAKLTNIYSTRFEVEIVDPTSSKKYRQVFEKNMTIARPPKITAAASAKKGYVKITFSPDLERFGLRRLDDDDNEAVIRRRAWDASACTGAKVKVTYNGVAIPVKTFEAYVDLFVGGGKKDVPRVFASIDRWDVAVAAAPDGFRHVSFVNGISTPKGGTHVNHVVTSIVEGIRASNKKYADVKPSFVRDHLFVFVRATLVNPSFSSQTKSECTSKPASFGSRFFPTDEFLKKIASKLSVMTDALALAEHREKQRLTKTDGVKTTTIRGIPKLEDATRAGTRDAHRATLILTEGDSAKTFAISGLSVVGREFFGVYPLRGKLLNVRDASPKQILENKEIQELKQILGLQQGKKYADVTGLRYGRVMILTDADLDGSHIKGLIINVFACFWPDLLRLGFVTCMSTPILRARKGAKTHLFYAAGEYDAWRAATPDANSWTIKYFKGLGTSTAAEAREYFGVVRDLTTRYERRSDDDDAAVDLAFRKQLANDRKGWIVRHSASPETFARREKIVPLVDFVHKELVHFSIADVARSIPSAIDGLKPSQRKVLYGAMKKPGLDREEIKVAQLAGYVAEVSAYHHGEASLQGTIVNMAQDYVGANNVNLLVPSGQFGTRLQGGKDAASARYIFTMLAPHTRRIFDPRDDPLLDRLEDDGVPIEPRYYVPTIPMVLVNGAEGIGTGFSTSVPRYDPEDLRANVERYLRSEPMKPMVPWYRGFTGAVTPDGDSSSFKIRGRFVAVGDREIRIEELPVGTWTQQYKEWLEDDARRKFAMTRFENHSTETSVTFRLFFDRDNRAVLESEDPHKTLGLVATVHTTNMYLFDADGRIARYDSPLDILREYCAVRLRYYEKRKAHLLETLARDVEKLEEKARFVRAVVDGSLVVFRRSSREVAAEMRAMKFSNVDDLLDARLHEFTAEKVAALEKTAIDKKREAEVLAATTPTNLWLKDRVF